MIYMVFHDIPQQACLSLLTYFVTRNSCYITARGAELNFSYSYYLLNPNLVRGKRIWSCVQEVMRISVEPDSGPGLLVALTLISLHCPECATGVLVDPGDPGGLQTGRNSQRCQGSDTSAYCLSQPVVSWSGG